MYKISFSKISDASVALFTSCLVFGAVQVSAASSATVAATVTVQNVSVSVADGTVAYGTLAVNTAKDTTSTGTDDSQTATNDGNVTADLNIRGQNTVAWTLAGSAGSNQYKHEFCITTCDSSPSWTALTTSNQTLKATTATSGTQTFDLKITTPTSSSSYTQQSVDVIVQASAS
jgi:hypothetical protein